MKILEQPSLFALSGNPMQYIIEAGSYDNIHSHFLHVKVQIYDGSEFVDLEDSEDAIPVFDQQATFDISSYIDKQLSPNFIYPDHYTNLVIKQDSMSLQYRIGIWERYYDIDNEEWQTSAIAASSSRYALKGGVSDVSRVILNEANMDFYSYMTDNMKFMTFTPSEKVIYPESIEKLYWFARETVSKKLMIMYKKVDNTNFYTMYADIDMTEGEMFELCVSPSLVQKYAGDDLVEYYTVQIYGVSEIKKYLIDYSYYERKDHFIFQNSLGVLETFTAVGGHQLDASFERMMTLRRLSTYNYFMDGGSKNNKLLSINKVHTSNTGILNKDMYDFMMMMMSSEKIWHISNGMPIPSTIITDSIRFEDSESDLLSISFEWGPAFQSRFHDAIGVVAEYILPPYWDKVECFFLRYKNGNLIDTKQGLTAEVTGSYINFPEIDGNDIFDLTNSTYWDLMFVDGFDDENSSDDDRIIYMDLFTAENLAESARDITHARLFFRDYNNSSPKSILPIIAYAESLTEDEQRVVVDWLDWLASVWTSDGDLLETSDNKLIMI